MSNRTLQLSDSLYEYLLASNPQESLVLEELRAVTEKDDMSRMQIAPEQGHFLHFLVKLIGARRVIEVGTYTGYSSIAMATALPSDGQMICCDVSEKWTAIAQRYWVKAHVQHCISLHIAPADETLKALIVQGERNRFDLAFIDADKESYDGYFEHCLDLVRPGGLIVIDNVLWGGAVADPSVHDADTTALRALNSKLKSDDRIDMCMLPVADGLTLVRKR